VGVIVDADSNPPRARPLANPTGLGAVMVEAPWLAPPAILPVPPAAGERDLPVAPVPAAAPAAGAVAGPASAAGGPAPAAAPAPRP
jgi:hypothetical protein